MKKVIVLVMILVFCGHTSAIHRGEPLWKREALTEGFFGLNEKLAESGLEVGFSITNVYQQNVKGGISTHDRRGRFAGSYDLELWADLEKMLGFEKSSVYLLIEGGWPDEEGIDTACTGSHRGTNADAIGNENIIVKELYYRVWLFDDKLELMIGKIDFTGYFDAIEYANDEVTQFLNGAFVDNPAIPFPEYSLGIMATYDFTDDLYLMGGVADAQADCRETGFRTAFHGEDYFFYILEAGLKARYDSANGPLTGTYRVGLWNDPQPKANSDSVKSYRDDTGFYLSFDQLIYKENSEVEDTQGLGTFFRYGYADSKKNDLANFWSVGFQYQGLFEGRDDDVFAAAFGQGFFSDSASSTYPADYEAAIECYYSAQIAPWFYVSPNIQYIKNPGGSASVGDAVVLGIRVLAIF